MKKIEEIFSIQKELSSKGILTLDNIEIISNNEEEFYKYTAMAFTVLSVISNLGRKDNEHIIHTNNADYIKGSHLDRFLPVNSQYDFRNIWVDLDKIEVVKDEELICLLNMLDD